MWMQWIMLRLVGPEWRIPSQFLPPLTPSVTKVSEENSLINLQPLWDKGIKGQGQVVAVIDSGVDPAHDIFRLTDISKAKFKSEADIEEAKKKGWNFLWQVVQ